MHDSSPDDTPGAPAAPVSRSASGLDSGPEPAEALSPASALGVAVWRWRRGPWAVVSLAVVVLVALPLNAFVWPYVTPASKADVVFVIGPPDEWRIEWAEQLVDAGLASAIMISVPVAAETALCVTGSYHGVPVLCHRPDPFTTQGEARWLQAEMAQHSWSTATVITMSTHVMRARLYFDRCIATGVTVIGKPTAHTFTDWYLQIRYQMGATLKAFLVTTTC